MPAQTSGLSLKDPCYVTFCQCQGQGGEYPPSVQHIIYRLDAINDPSISHRNGYLKAIHSIAASEAYGFYKDGAAVACYRKNGSKYKAVMAPKGILLG